MTFTGDSSISITANGGFGGAANNNTTATAGGAVTAGADASYAGGKAGASGSGGGPGGAGASDISAGNDATSSTEGATTIGSDSAHNGGAGGTGGGPGDNGGAGTTPGGGGGGARTTSSTGNFATGGAGGAGQIILTYVSSMTNTAIIGTPTYSSVPDSSAPNHNLTTTGTQDWQIYGDFSGLFSVDTSVGKLYGNSISVEGAVNELPCDVEQTDQRSSQTFTWTDGIPTPTGTNVAPYNNGFIYANAGTFDYGANYETITFVPGDTSAHIVHLYGYLAGDSSGVGFQFSNSLAGAAPVVFTTNPSVGDFDYTVAFQAKNPNDELTVVWTFSKTDGSTGLKAMGIQAATMSGNPPSAPPPGLVNWRVIPDDTNYPTSDALVAGLVIGDTNYLSKTLPANPAAQDCSAYFQEAMSWLSSKGGGTVYVPPGHYRFDNNLTIPVGVTLRGRWAKPGPSQPVTGTILDIYAGAGDTNAPAFLTGSGKPCGLRDMALWYPNQNPTNWVYYPTTISCPNTGLRTVDNVTLVNSYLGCDIPYSAHVAWRGLYGTTLMRGISVNHGAAVPRFEDVHLGSEYWGWSGLPGAPAPAEQAAMTSMMQANTNSMGFEVLNSAGMYFIDCSFSGYCYGIRIGNINGSFYGAVVTNCTEALRINYAVGLDCINCTFSGLTYGYHRVGGKGPNFYGCALSGGSYAVYQENVAVFSSIDFDNCTFDGSVSLSHYCKQLSMNGCSFAASTPTNIILNSVGTAQIVCDPGARCGPANVQINGSVPSPYLNTTSGVVPLPPATFPMGYGKMRKPDKLELFDVKSTNYSAYGAYGDGVHDDTAAIQATINAAQANGGGIVMFPAGNYVVTGNLTVSNGVELRGANGSGRPANASPGSLLVLKNPPGDPDGTPILTLGDRCGVVGLSFQQYYMVYQNGAFATFPYIIQCAGVSNYLVGCCGGAAYRSLDVNGARDTLIDYCWFGGYDNIMKVRGGATNCRYQNSHSQPWASIDGAPRVQGGAVGNNGDETAKTFIAEDCTNLVIVSVYCHISQTMLTMRGEASVSTLMVNGEQMQRGYVLESGGGAVYALQSGSNINNSGDGRGAYDWWLQTNYTGTATMIGGGVNTDTANYGLRVDNPQARWSGYCLGFRDKPIWNLKAAGQVTLVGGYMSQCTQEVPAGGSLVLSQSSMDAMPYVSQAGTVNFSTNNVFLGNSYVVANMNWIPPIDNGIVADTNNLTPAWQSGDPYYDVNGNPMGGGVGVDLTWTLASGSNFAFHVTSPYFADGARPNVTITATCAAIPTNGSVKLSYDSTSGMKTMNGLSATVSDARFGAADGVDILLTASNCNPVVKSVAVYATSYLGVAPQLSALEAWRLAYFGTPYSSGSAADAADPDGDRLANLGEYALGGNPTNAADAGAVPYLLNAGGGLCYIHAMRSDDPSLAYTVETSTNLVSGSWTNAGYMVSGTNVTGSTLNYVTNTIPTDLDRTYIRLKVKQ